ncbi:MAG: hypothetical protein AAGG72_09770 [Pseudomonadota bacterium]
MAIDQANRDGSTGSNLARENDDGLWLNSGGSVEAVWQPRHAYSDNSMFHVRFCILALGRVLQPDASQQ